MVKSMMRSMLAALVLAVTTMMASAQPLPPPFIKYVTQYPVPPGLIHVDFTVVNWNAYAPVLFAPAPNLPPCGLNPASSRTWVDIFNAVTGVRIYGFCSLGAPFQLIRLWFATPPASKPKWVYITMTNQLTHRRVRSNRIAIP
jgi:hypothetical protein